jgi:hypothetical protein
VCPLQRFRGWLDKHGPFDLTLDGANLAFWGENYSQGGFKAWKIRVAFDHMQQLYPDAKILVVSARAAWQAGLATRLGIRTGFRRRVLQG